MKKTFKYGIKAIKTGAIVGMALVLWLLPASLQAQITNTNPAVSIVASNQIALTITNGTVNATYLIYGKSTLISNANTYADWVPQTNGAANQTNFFLALPVSDTEFYRAVYNTNFYPFTLHISIVTPTNGSLVQ